MAISNDKATKDYESARDGFNNIAHSFNPAVTDEQKKEAREARDRLNLEYVGKQIADVKERTKLYAEFIEEMKQIIQNIDADGSLDELNTIRNIVDSAAEVIEGGEE